LNHYCAGRAASLATTIQPVHPNGIETMKSPADFLDVRLQSDRYRIRSLLSEGSLATVYRAHDAHRDRDVVVKVVHAAVSKAEGFLTSFRRELSKLATLAHPGIVRLTDSGEHDGLTYVVLDYLDHGDLIQMRPKRRDGQSLELQPSTLRVWLPQVADALDYLHTHGLVHRDVRPATVLFGGKDSVCLSDFVMTHVLASTPLFAGAVLGDPRYFSPERSEGQPADAWSDQYALAATVFEWIAGSRPARGITPPDLRLVVKCIPDSVATAIRRALSARADDRFLTCSLFAEAVLEETAIATVPAVPVTFDAPAAIATVPAVPVTLDEPAIACIPLAEPTASFYQPAVTFPEATASSNESNIGESAFVDLVGEPLRKKSATTKHRRIVALVLIMLGHAVLGTLGFMLLARLWNDPEANPNSSITKRGGSALANNAKRARPNPFAAPRNAGPPIPPAARAFGGQPQAGGFAGGFAPPPGMMPPNRGFGQPGGVNVGAEALLVHATTLIAQDRFAEATNVLKSYLQWPNVLAGQEARQLLFDLGVLDAFPTLIAQLSDREIAEFPTGRPQEQLNRISTPHIREVCLARGNELVTVERQTRLPVIVGESVPMELVVKKPGDYEGRMVTSADYVFLATHIIQQRNGNATIRIHDRNSATLCDNAERLQALKPNFYLSPGLAERLSTALEQHGLSVFKKPEYKGVITFKIRRSEPGDSPYWLAEISQVRFLCTLGYSDIVAGGTPKSAVVLRVTPNGSVLAPEDSAEWVLRLGGDKFIAPVKRKYDELRRTPSQSQDWAAFDAWTQQFYNLSVQYTLQRNAALNARMEYWLRTGR
jgi:serine/threonine protein kinase